MWLYDSRKVWHCIPVRKINFFHVILKIFLRVFFDVAITVAIAVIGSVMGQFDEAWVLA